MRKTAILCLAALSLAVCAQARTKLAALPARESVTVHLEDQGRTLVEEERVLTLSKGENLIDFSWRGVRVQPDSLRIAFQSHPDGVRLLSTAYPRGEEALVWRVASEGAWEERVKVSYLLASIDRLVEYRALASKDEKTLDLSAYLILRNFSGELLENARFVSGQGQGFGATSADGETRKALLSENRKIPVRKVLVWDASTQPWEPGLEDSTPGLPVYYRLENSKPANLGAGALREGKVRVYQEDGRGSAIFLGEDRAKLTPVNAELSINIGESREVAVTLRKSDEKRLNPRPSRQVTVLHDAEESYTAEVENFKDSPSLLEIVQHIEGEWSVTKSSVKAEKKDAGTLLIKLEAAPKSKVSLDWVISRRNIRY